MAERAVCVVGSGLIGGSLLRAAEKAGRTVWGASASEGTAAQACADGFDVTINTDAALRRAADSDALVVLAVPLPAVPDVLRRVDAIAPTCRLTDAVSVKVAVADAVDRYAPRARYVGGHPMAGTAESGWAAGDAELFTGAAWVVAADDGLDLDVWRDVAELAWACGARVVPAAADEHDLAVARVSHLPHLLAAVLAAVGAGTLGRRPAARARRVVVRRRHAGGRHPSRAGARDVRGQPRRAAGRGGRRARAPGRHARGARVDGRARRDGEGRVRGPDALVGDA